MEPRLSFVHLHSLAGSSFAQAVCGGLAKEERTLPCRFFYDARGSLLFEQITHLPEYYLTRTEQAILCERAKDIVDCTAGITNIIEFGSGSSSKTRTLLDAACDLHKRVTYSPIDISFEFLEQTATGLVNMYSNLHVDAIAAEYSDAIEWLQPSDEPRLFVFLGSNIGNFEESEAQEFLTSIRGKMRECDRMLIGTDMHKDTRVIERAYNDSAGVTREFNRNLLHRMRDELGSNVDPELFEHRAPYMHEKQRIEMWLVSTRDQKIDIPAIESTYLLKKGDKIVTEYSHKYTKPSLERLFASSGFSVEQQWLDDRKWFALSLLSPVSP